MQSTKKQNPFTAFNWDYYQNLMLVDEDKAEEYRRKTTSSKDGAEDLIAKRQAILAKQGYNVYINENERKRLGFSNEKKVFNIADVVEVDENTPETDEILDK